MSHSQTLHDFVSATRYEDLPSPVQAMAQRCLIDLAGTAVAGLQTELSAIICDHAGESSPPGPFRRGRGCSSTAAPPACRARRSPAA